MKAHKGRVGYPTGNKVCNKSKSVCKQKFSKGTLVYRAKKGTFAVTGTIGKKWEAKASKLGHATADRVSKKVRVSKKSKKTVTVYSQTFDKGKIVQKGSGPAKASLFKKKK